MLEVKGLTTRFEIHGGVFSRVVGHVHAVENFSLRVREGEIVSVVGESGCGKSTLGNTLAGLVPATSGEARLDGLDLLCSGRRRSPELSQKLQMIFQDPYTSLNPRLTIREMLGEVLLYHRVCDKSEVEDRTVELLKMVELPAEAMSRFPHAFSGGQRQRIGIARALAVRPKVIICDEIVSALDVSIQAQILQLLLRLRDEMKLSLLFISHDMSVVRGLSDRIAVMYLGHLVEEAPTEELMGSPKHPYTRALLDAVPSLDRSRRPIALTGELPSATHPPRGCPFVTRCPRVGEICHSEFPEWKDGCACYFRFNRRG